MRLSKPLLLLLFITLATTAHAASIDMDDPRRALGREDDVRIDAQLVNDTLTPGGPIAVKFQIQNLTAQPIAIADKLATASYDTDTRTVTLSIGSETPQEMMPHVVIIAPQEKKILQASAVPSLNAAAMRTRLGGTPRYVQLKVSILRDLAPFRALIEKQAQGAQPLPDALFDQWFESNDTIALNSVPVDFRERTGNRWDADQADASQSSME
jgi:hypothetical protein